MHQNFFVFIFLIRSFHSSLTVIANTPLVIWHGMGDTCCNPHTAGGLANRVKIIIPDIYIHSIEIGENPIDDTINSFFMDTNEKISIACAKIKNDPNLKNGYHAMGFSQGSQFLRAVAQRCPNPPMFNLISVGGQHQGVYGLPNCYGGFMCNLITKAISFFAYFGYIQRNFVQAAYWHDPFNEKDYRKYNIFLADINQENKFNLEYKLNMIKLKSFVMVKFANDHMIQPVESQWFGFYKENDIGNLYTMEESPLYMNDTLGLKTLHLSGRLHKLTVPGRHMQLNLNWLIEHIILPFLKDSDES